jgi:uncharacterized repeat protein (TIGR02543 family)
MKTFISKMICIAFMAMLCAWNVNAQSYNIVLVSNPALGGILSGEGVYEQGTEVTVTATPNLYFEFINWIGENGAEVSAEAEHTFTVRGDRILVANFVPGTCEITVSAVPPESGEVSGGGVYTYGDPVTVSAVAHYGFQFKNWTEDGKEVSTYANYLFTASTPRALVANFAPAKYGVGIVLNPFEGGTASGSGVYTHGDEVVVSAEAYPDYEFVNWTEYGEALATTPDYAFIALKSRSLVANFTTSGKTITVLTNMPEGEVLGGGVYHYGDEVTVEAIPNTGYIFVSWTEGRGALSTDNPYTFTVTEDLVLVANFEKDGMLPIEPIDGGAMMIYPNPTNSEMTVVLNDLALKIVEMELYDLAGKKVYQQTVNQSYGTLQLSELAQGAYVLKVYLDQGEIAIRKIVKQ